jgi:tetratricopeptide (TPR) repeat protein
MRTLALGRAALAGLFALLLLADVAYFGRRWVASVIHWEGERAFHAGRYARALRLYETTLVVGAADRHRVMTDIAEFLVFGLGQADAGMTQALTLPGPVAMDRATEVIRKLIADRPHVAYTWSLASDLSFHEAHQRRRSSSIDLSTLSENPVENLMSEERRGIAELELATHLEPNNYLYHDLLVERFLELGMPEAAAPHVRHSLAALPDLDDHLYLLRRDLPATLLDSALEGFQDARARPSLLTAAAINLDAARLLSHHGRHSEAGPLIQAALEEAPRSFLAHYLAGHAALNLNDWKAAAEHFDIATRLSPDDAWAHASLGVARLAMDDRDGAIVAFTTARELDPGEIRFFHRLGAALESAGRLPEAERQYVAAANLNTDEVDAWRELIDFYQRRGDGAALVEVCERVATLHPGHDFGAARCGTRTETP